MGSTAIGREASRVVTWGDGRAGPDREHARRVPFSGDAGACRLVACGGVGYAARSFVWAI